MGRKPLYDKREIGQRIAEVRRDYGKSQEQFAKELGLRQQTLSKYESGEVRVPRYVVVAIAYLFRVSEEWLLTGYGAKLATEQPGITVEDHHAYSFLIKRGLGAVLDLLARPHAKIPGLRGI